MITEYRPISRVAFMRLPRAQQKIAIAKDIISRLDARLLGGSTMCTLDNKTRHRLAAARDATEVQEYVNHNHCEACAKGAVFLSWIGIMDSVKPASIHDVKAYFLNSFPAEMVRVFGERCLHAMEVAYEGNVLGCPVGIISGIEQKSILTMAIFSRNSGYSERFNSCLRAIATNIITNEGDFVIPSILDGKPIVF